MKSLVIKSNTKVKYNSRYPIKTVISTDLNKFTPGKVHSKRPYTDYSVEVGQLMLRFIPSLFRF